MLSWINNSVMALADPLLNWLLRLPADLALVIVAVGTGSIITFSRLFTTNQDLLRRCDQDRKRLKDLIREAKARKDREAVARCRATKNMIGLITMRQEGLPLLAAILPIAILGTWCFHRMAFVPPRAGETVTVRACFPVSAAGELAHLVPQAGLREVSGTGGGPRERWIQGIAADHNPKTGSAANAVAAWQLRADARSEPYKLLIRHGSCTAEKELRVGQRIYSPDVQLYGAGSSILTVQIGMKPVKLLGVVPGIGWLHLPPWLVAYFLIAIPSVSAIKKLAGIH